jgi:hypothetical protein
MVHKQALDAALAQVEFIAQHQQTASAARTLVSMARRRDCAGTFAIASSQDGLLSRPDSHGCTMLADLVMWTIPSRPCRLG